MKKILFIIAVIATMICPSIKADTPVKIHAIVFCNTNDPKIGESCENDQKRFVEELGIIQDALDCDVDWMNVYTGKECNKPNLEKALSNLNCNSNDVIFFYYSGHGVHAKSDVAEGWLPQMCLIYESYDQDKFVPVTDVMKALESKPARLKLIVTDCCNNEASWVSSKSLVVEDGKTAKSEEINVKNLKKLFYESKGTVVATSSKRGQVSLGPKEGGLFSIAFWDEIYKLEQGNGNADWKFVFESTKKRTLEYSSGKQEPVFKLYGVENVDNNPNPVPDPVVIVVNDEELTKALKQITNSRRLDLVSGVVDKFFTPNAKVVILGRNLTTKIGMPMDISKYLEQLALSKTVKGINIVKKVSDNNGKYNYIEISEIR